MKFCELFDWAGLELPRDKTFVVNFKENLA
jgi:hypothetical protein